VSVGTYWTGTQPPRSQHVPSGLFALNALAGQTALPL
jgi:hypothetical protein